MSESAQAASREHRSVTGVGRISEGERFGKLVAVRPAPKATWPGNGRVVVWECRCDCGRACTARATNLRQGRTTKCLVCVHAHRQSFSKTHGLSESREYRSWAQMVARCTRPRNKRFEHYGGRGITVCSEWLGRGGFDAFIDHIGMMPDDSPRWSLGRKNNDGHYEPGNVRWETSVTQANNTSRSRFVVHNGQRKTIAEWAREAGLSYEFVRHRVLNLGMSVAEAIALPKYTRKKRKS